MTQAHPHEEPRRATDLADCTCATLRKAARVITQVYDAALRPAGLKATQFTLLATLAKLGDVPLTQLAEALVLDRTTLTRNLGPLTARGLVSIEHEKDQRVRTISLTGSGRRLFEQALPHWQKAQSRLVQDLGHERWSGFIDDLVATVDTIKSR